MNHGEEEALGQHLVSLNQGLLTPIMGPRWRHITRLLYRAIRQSFSETRPAKTDLLPVRGAGYELAIPSTGIRLS